MCADVLGICAGDLYQAAIAPGDYITQIDYYPFEADWERYLGCGIVLHLNSGNTISFLGTFYADTRYCGAKQTFVSGGVAPSQITNIQVTTSAGRQGVTGVEATSLCSGCALCAAGTYKSGGGSAACTSCPTGSTAPAGSLTSGACTTVNACAAGFYGNGVSCTSCGTGFTSAAGSTSSANCYVSCGLGFYADAGSCTSCAAGFTAPAGSAISA